jgi:hypothetical protein
MAAISERRRAARGVIGELAAKIEAEAVKLSLEEMSVAMEACRTLRCLQHGYVMRLVDVETGKAR